MGTEYSIDELIDFSIGGGWGTESPEPEHTLVSVIRGTDIPRVAAGELSSVPQRFESNRKLKSRLLEAGDVILEVAGGSAARGQFTGRTLLVTDEIIEQLGPTICASFCKRLVLRHDLVEPKFFFYFMQDFYKSGRVADYDSQSTGISNFRFAEFLSNETVELPSRPEQTAVSGFLGLLDQRIRLNDQITRTLESIAQALFRSWFVDFDPVRAKMAGEKPAGMDDATAALFPDSMEDSELGYIPVGWEVRTVGKVLYRHPTKGLPKSTLLSGEGTALVLTQGDNVVAGFADVQPQVQSSAQDPHFIFGDHTCRMHLSTLPFSVLPNTLVLSARALDCYWAYHATLGRQTFESYRRHWSELAQKTVIVPGVDPAAAFGRVVKPLYAFRDSLMLEKFHLQIVRDALLPRLISGELQIPEDLVA